MLSTKNLSYSYPGATSIAFEDINLQRQDHLLVLGQSGKGKTTLLHLLAGLIVPENGNIVINNQNLKGLNTQQMDRFRGKNIGLVFQKSYFIRALSVMENLVLAQQLGLGKVNKAHITQTLQNLNIEQHQNKIPSRLSVGEQQRVSIARAVINKPVLILADEPTSALDDENASDVASLLEKTALENNATLLVVTHDKRLTDKFTNTMML